MTVKTLYGERILVTNYKEKESSSLITSVRDDEAELKDSQWFKISQVGTEVSDEFSVGDIILLAPLSLRSNAVYEFGDSETKYVLITENQIVGKADV